jgi:hypothetical protein
MKSLRSILVYLLPLTTVLLMAQAAVAGPKSGGKGGGNGNGGKGGTAAVGIELVVFTNFADGTINAEISGGGFTNGANPVVTLDGVIPLTVRSVTSSMINATIPAGVAGGNYSLTVSTGAPAKNNAATDVRLGGVMSVACIDWFRSGPQDEHVHTEVHVEDENGDAVIGATVTWTAENESGIYQTNVSAALDNDGHANGAGCVDPADSGVTDWFCCIGAGKWGNDGPPGKRACDPGTYTATIDSVERPPFTNMKWDGGQVSASIELFPKPQ